MKLILTLWRLIAGSAIGRALGGLAVGLAMAWAYARKKVVDDRRERAAEEAKEYRDERKRIDEDLDGLPSDDDARRRKLQSIAERRSAGKD